MKHIKLSKSDADLLLKAWAKINILLCYAEYEEMGEKMFTEKFSLRDHVHDVHKILDEVVTNLPDRDNWTF